MEQCASSHRTISNLKSSYVRNTFNYNAALNALWTVWVSLAVYESIENHTSNIETWGVSMKSYRLGSTNTHGAHFLYISKFIWQSSHNYPLYRLLRFSLCLSSGNRQLVLPDCLKLPESNTPEADNCVSIGVPMPNVFNPSKCII